MMDSALSLSCGDVYDKYVGDKKSSNVQIDVYVKLKLQIRPYSCSSI